MTPEYVILSDLVGVPGEPYEPKPGVNVAALLSNGFIAERPQLSTNKPQKGRKVKKDTEE